MKITIFDENVCGIRLNISNSAQGFLPRQGVVINPPACSEPVPPNPYVPPPTVPSTSNPINKPVVGTNPFSQPFVPKPTCNPFNPFSQCDPGTQIMPQPPNPQFQPKINPFSQGGFAPQDVPPRGFLPPRTNFDAVFYVVCFFCMG